MYDNLTHSIKLTKTPCVCLCSALENLPHEVQFLLSEIRVRDARVEGGFRCQIHSICG
jgi:hypothetical protein